MCEQSIRIGALRDILLYTFGVFTTICSQEDFSPQETNAPYPHILYALIRLLGEKGSTRGIPDLSTYEEGKQYIYSDKAGMLWNFCIAGSRIYLLGPIFTDGYSISDIISFMESGHIVASKKDIVEFSRRIPLLSSYRMHLCGMMLHSCLTATAPSLQNMVTLDMQAPQTPPFTYRDRVADYRLERRIWKAIRDGNLNYRKELEIVFPALMVGDMSPQKYLRQEKNQAVVVASVGCRAAIEGGLNPNIAYNLSEQFIQKIEACDTIAHITALTTQIIDSYILRVHQVKRRSDISPQICDCCEYLSLHPEESLDVQELAARYNYTPYYFSKKFRKETGQSIHSFMTKQKIEKAQELLLFSSLSLSDISDFLGYNSQSYFGSVFKSVTGVTPGTYREKACLNDDQFE